MLKIFINVTGKFHFVLTFHELLARVAYFYSWVLCEYLGNMQIKLYNLNYNMLYKRGSTFALINTSLKMNTCKMYL